MKGIFSCAVLSVLLMLFAATAVQAQCGDPLEKMEVDCFQHTMNKYFHKDISIPVNNRAVESYASQLMLIKNGMSLYRDGCLNKKQVELLRAIVDQHARFGSKAISSLGTSKYRSLAENIHYNALHASEVLKIKWGSEQFRSAMEKYHTTTGYNSYRRAQDMGIDQVWED